MRWSNALRHYYSNFTYCWKNNLKGGLNKKKRKKNRISLTNCDRIVLINRLSCWEYTHSVINPLQPFQWTSNIGIARLAKLTSLRTCDIDELELRLNYRANCTAISLNCGTIRSFLLNRQAVSDCFLFYGTEGTLHCHPACLFKSHIPQHCLL